MVDPVLQIACFQEVLDDPQKPIVLRLLPQNRHQDPMVEAVEALRDIALDEPDDALPRMANLGQGRLSRPLTTMVSALIDVAFKGCGIDIAGD